MDAKLQRKVIAVRFSFHYLKIKINLAAGVSEIGKKSNFASYEKEI
ncbi:MAG: hypothetical protein MJ000_04530 [Bacteroidales bacterium]|nr:hypothetical protein [Bacteroidales bacterium]